MGDHVRATADVITTEQTVTDSNLTYIPENGTVRYPATTSGGEVVSYGTISFDVWAEIEAVEAGARAVQDELDATIPGERMSTTSIANHGDIPIHVGVDHLTVVNEDGDVVYETPVSARELVNRVPRSVTATIHFAGQTATNTVPVYVEKVWRDCGAPLDVSCPEPAE